MNTKSHRNGLSMQQIRLFISTVAAVLACFCCTNLHAQDSQTYDCFAELNLVLNQGERNWYLARCSEPWVPHAQTDLELVLEDINTLDVEDTSLIMAWMLVFSVSGFAAGQVIRNLTRK